MKKFEITKEQILELANESSFTKATLNKMFPQAFESELEVGKWYKMPKYGDAIFCITKLQNRKCFAYGINYMGEWRDEKDFATTDSPEEFILATDKEVETALIAEAKRRGVNKTTMITQTFNENQKMCIGFWDERSVKFERNKLFAKGVRIFDNGKWAEIISKPIELTLEQIAEKFNVNVEQLKIKK